MHCGETVPVCSVILSLHTTYYLEAFIWDMESKSIDFSSKICMRRHERITNLLILTVCDCRLMPWWSHTFYDVISFVICQALLPFCTMTVWYFQVFGQTRELSYIFLYFPINHIDLTQWGSRDYTCRFSANFDFCEMRKKILDFLWQMRKMRNRGIWKYHMPK